MGILEVDEMTRRCLIFDEELSSSPLSSNIEMLRAEYGFHGYTLINYTRFDALGATLFWQFRHVEDEEWILEKLLKSTKSSLLRFPSTQGELRQMKITFDPAEIPPWRRKPKKLPQPIEAWRLWKVALNADKKEYVLRSIVTLWRGNTWSDRVAKADRPPISPDRKSGSVQDSWNSGLHTVKEEYLDEAFARYFPDCIDAAGRVHIWGRVVEWTKGYTAQYAMPLEIFIFPTGAFYNLENVRDILWRRYDCAVRIHGPSGPTAKGLIMHSEAARKAAGEDV